MCKTTANGTTITHLHIADHACGACKKRKLLFNGIVLQDFIMRGSGSNNYFSIRFSYSFQ